MEFVTKTGLKTSPGSSEEWVTMAARAAFASERECDQAAACSGPSQLRATMATTMTGTEVTVAVTTRYGIRGTRQLWLRASVHAVARRRRLMEDRLKRRGIGVVGRQLAESVQHRVERPAVAG